MKRTGTPADILTAIIQEHPEVTKVLKRVRERVPAIKREIAAYQAAALYALVKPYNVAGSRILEIGTAYGYSAAVMAEAAPLATIITLNPKESEVELAKNHLLHYRNVTVLPKISWEYLAEYTGQPFDVIFVDGDHKRIALDMPWWEWVKPGGLFFHHDYSPAGTYRECPPVYECLNEWAQRMEHPLDVLVVDDGGVGMAGFYKNGR